MKRNKKRHVTFSGEKAPKVPTTPEMRFSFSRVSWSSLPTFFAKRKRKLFIGLGVALIIVGITLISTRNHKAVTEIPLAFELSSETKTVEAPQKNENIYEFDIKEGYALYAILKNRGMNKTDVENFISNKKIKETFRNFKPGDFLRFEITEDKKIKWLEYTPSALSLYRIEPKGDSFVIHKKESLLEKRIEIGHGKIITTLYGSGVKAGIPEDIITQMIDAFSWKIDFKSETQKNDTFAVLYEAYYNDQGHKVSNGALLAALFTNRGKTHRATRYKVGKKHGFYDGKGKSLNKTFNRYPLGTKYAVTSSYNPRRVHPIFKTIRPHRGTDFGAPRGTPVRAPSAGKVQFAGWQRGYGRTLILNHGQGITTLYAHLSRFGKGVKKGAHVRQNQIVAKVGTTGASTGPHLHYEFRVNGKHKNPMKVKLAYAAPLPKKHMSAFKKAHTEHQNKLDFISQFAEPVKP